MKNAAALPFIMLAAGLIACAGSKPTTPPVLRQSGAASSVSDQPVDAAAGKSEEVASMMSAATATSHDDLNPVAVDSLTSAASAPPVLPNTRADESGAVSVAEQMAAESNRLRAAAGRPPQTLDSRLTDAAQEQAAWLASHGYPFAYSGSGHYGNGDWYSRAQKYGFRPGHVAEVIDTVAGDSIPQAFADWRGSQSHYAAVLANDDVCGFGSAYSSNYGRTIYVGLYGTEGSAPLAAARPVTYTQTFSSCGPGGCGPAMFQRRGLFGRRR